MYEGMAREEFLKLMSSSAERYEEESMLSCASRLSALMGAMNGEDFEREVTANRILGSNAGNDDDEFDEEEFEV